jgi:hypothetical protein
MRCEQRTLDDIRALGGNDAADERRFATAARVSETNLALYRAFAQPVVRSLFNAPIAEWMHRMHPLRLQFELFSDANPLMSAVGAMAEQIRRDRSPASPDNPFLALQQNASRQIVAALDAWRDIQETFAEDLFLSIYGSPVLQAAVGIDTNGTRSMRRAGRSPLHRQLKGARIAELKSHISRGGLNECLMRAALYVGMPRGGIDERGFDTVRRIRKAREGMPRLTLAAFKALVREQYFMLLIDPEATLAAIPDLLPPDDDTRRKAFAVVREVISARGEITGEVAERLARIAQLFGVESEADGVSTVAALSDARKSRKQEGVLVRRCVPSEGSIALWQILRPARPASARTPNTNA